ncbi:hypothetical protein [Rhizobium ruizarguesonis]|uniref:hypothetical protein n=1 Tax=Rhizobium ruizarguesonis TaxID=2081791 RepID=UPI0037CA432A
MCQAEGDVVVDCLRRLRASGCVPNIYIVTPFVVVQDRLRELLRRDGVLESWVDDPYSWVRERIGTVHTVQGREAEAVIFVLGAPEAAQRGARGWAGGSPQSVERCRNAGEGGCVRGRQSRALEAGGRFPVSRPIVMMRGPKSDRLSL